jgi:hypothetical protein
MAVLILYISQRPNKSTKWNRLFQYFENQDVVLSWDYKTQRRFLMTHG